MVKSSDFRGECLDSTGCALVGQDLGPCSLEARRQEADQAVAGVNSSNGTLKRQK